MGRWNRATDLSKTVGRITADEARELVGQKQQAIMREAEIKAVLYHGMVAQRIYEAAQNGETELHFLFGDIPTLSRMPVIRRLQADGFEVHDDMYGGVASWLPLRRDMADNDEAPETRAEPLLLLPGVSSPTIADIG